MIRNCELHSFFSSSSPYWRSHMCWLDLSIWIAWTLIAHCKAHAMALALHCRLGYYAKESKIAAGSIRRSFRRLLDRLTRAMSSLSLHVSIVAIMYISLASPCRGLQGPCHGVFRVPWELKTIKYLLNYLFSMQQWNIFLTFISEIMRNSCAV